MRHPDKHINAIISIIDRPRKCRRIVFAGEGRALSEMRLETSGLLEYLVSGNQHIRFYRKGKVVSHVLRDDEIFFVPPGHPYHVSWELDCRRVGIVAGEFGRLSISWNNHTPERSRIVSTADLWYSSEIREENDIFALFSALGSRIGFPENSSITCDLALLIIRRIAEHLENGSHGLPGHSAYRTFQQVSAYLETNCRNPVSRKELAHKFSLHPDYITRLFREFSDCGFTEYLLRIRMMSAVWYLSNTGLPIHEIAETCGFYDAAHFIRKFRAQYKQSPGRYRSAGANPQ